jgi:endonuclease/exonuclease/phosphatase family metal-dependent hydrolase
MKLMTYNILEGGTGRIDPIAEVIRLAGADVVILQEATDGELFHRLADRVGMDRFLAENPRTGGTHGGSPHGVGLLSRLPLSRGVNLAAIDPRFTRGALAARVGEGAAALDLIGLHLHSKETVADEAVRLGEVEAALEHARPLSPRHVIAGDFNASHPQQLIDLAALRPASRARVEAQGGMIPRHAITRMLAAGYVDAHAMGRGPAEFGKTLTTSKPGMRVDYFFVPAAMAGGMKECEVFMPEIGKYASDHWPMVLELG